MSRPMIRVNDGIVFVPLAEKKKRGKGKIEHPKPLRPAPSYHEVKREECKPCPFCKREMVGSTSTFGLGMVWAHPSNECWFSNITGGLALVEATERLSLWNQRGDEK